VQAKTEQERLKQQNSGKANWHQWGPYLSERAWGTVREDYSVNGDAWGYFPHDHARSRAYRWNEDGLAGISDDHQYLCFALALWNGRDLILKERLFGLTGPQGNHGEDVKEYYFYLDNTPTHSYMKMLYKYPQQAFPYSDLVDENGRRGFHEFEYELLDTGVFDDNRYFDVQIEYAKADVDDILIRISVTNQASEEADCTLLPTLWFRNTWSWGYEAGPMRDTPEKPQLSLHDSHTIKANHAVLGTYYLHTQQPETIVFTENETHNERLFGTSSTSKHVKDAFHRYVIYGEIDAVNPSQMGTKAAPIYRLHIAAGETKVVNLRLTAHDNQQPYADINKIFKQRIAEADEFYESVSTEDLDTDRKRIQRQALAGMLWSKQLYYYDVQQWLAGDPQNKAHRHRPVRNDQWQHLNNFDIVSMPDKWEYPWYAVWDSAFHCIPLAMIDSEFAKQQLILFTREWYMHPNGQLPAYEWKFSDVNPPVHAWAAYRVYEMDGKRDVGFLKRIFNKMLLNFTWWVNRKDADGNNIFQGGFLGLDNISLFDRSSQLPTGGHIDQSDGTAWMGFYCLTMLNISIELAKHDPSYEDMAIKFYEHFLDIALAMSGVVHDGVGLWDEQDGFFYDVLHLPNGSVFPLRVRSLVGLMSLIAVETVGQATLDSLPDFARSLKWIKTHRPQLTEAMASVDLAEYGEAHLFSIPTPEQLKSVLRYLLDEDEFLSPYGIRSLSKAHAF